jgi:phospho-N-acetylmuramoyl-pentapeptide-transferase
MWNVTIVPAYGLLRLFFISLAASALLAYPIWKLLIRWKSRQTVSQYAPEGHQIKQGTPTMGGLIIAAGALIAYALVTATWGDSTGPNVGVVGLILFGGFGLIGFVDDFLVPRLIKGKRGLGWKQKILMQVVVAALGVLVFNGWHFDWLFGLSVFLILFFSNAYNFSDGLDGLAGTLLLGFGGGLLALAWSADFTAPLTILVVPLLAAVIPFLYVNAPPAKVFMGDVGSLPIGAVLGFVASMLVLTPRLASQYWLFPYPNVSAVWPQTHAMANPWMLASIMIVSLVMIAELVPVPLQILSVKLFKRRVFPYTPIHHAFEKAGWKETRVVAMFALTQVVLSVLGVWLFLETMPHPEIISR